MRKLLSIALVLFLIMSSSCKLIYPNRVPVVKPKKHYSWYKPKFKKRKRTKIVWMKVHKKKHKKAAPVPPELPVSEAPDFNP